MSVVNSKENIDIIKRLDLIAMIEFAKAGAKRQQVRKIMGALDNNLFSKINSIFGNGGKK